MKERLKQLVLEYAFQFSEVPAFKLVHGGLSSFYFNCKRVTLDPEGQYLIGNLVFAAIREMNVKAIGGLTLGADPIANAVAYTSWLQGKPVQAFVVRKKQKDHGTCKPDRRPRGTRRSSGGGRRCGHHGGIYPPGDRRLPPERS